MQKGRVNIQWLYYQFISLNSSQLLFSILVGFILLMVFRKDKDSEMQRIGMVSTKYIEFYNAHKEIVVTTTRKYRDGSTSTSECGILSIKEFGAIQKQVLELNWH